MNGGPAPVPLRGPRIIIIASQVLLGQPGNDWHVRTMKFAALILFLNVETSDFFSAPIIDERWWFTEGKVTFLFLNNVLVQS